MKRFVPFFLLIIGCEDPSMARDPIMDFGIIDSSLDAATSENTDVDLAPVPDQQAMESDAMSPPTDLSVAPADVEVILDVESMDAGVTIWRGQRIVFEKPDFADPTSPEAQDRITDGVVLTRGDGNVLFNIEVEVSANAAVSPRGTLWAMGRTDDLDNLSFSPLREAANDRMQDLPGKDMVLLITDENIYIDVRFLSWRSGRGRGGGFSYERSSPN